MTREVVAERVIQIIQICYVGDRIKVVEETRFYCFLQCQDDFEVLRLDLEEDCDVNILTKQFESVNTVGDVIDLIVRLRQEQGKD